MDTPWVDWHALWQIVVYGLLFGAGLPFLWALGMRALSMGDGQVQAAGVDPDDDKIWAGNVAGLVIAVICFAIVVAGAAAGIVLIVRGAKQ